MQQSLAKFSLALLLVAAGAGTSSAVRAARIDPQECAITVQYTRDSTVVLDYTRAFTVGLGAPYSEDFSMPTRIRSFDANLSSTDSVPVVSFALDADVGVFDTIELAASLKVHDEKKGETTTGSNTHWTSVPSPTGGTSVRHHTTYTLTCGRAQ